MPKGPFFIAIISAVGMAVAGAELWLVAAILLLWFGSLWLIGTSGETEQDAYVPTHDVTDIAAAFLEPVDAPLLLVDANRIVSANETARLELGAHVVGQDVRVALRHPAAVALLNAEPQGRDNGVQATLIQGLTSSRSLFEMRVRSIDARYRLIQLTDRSREADISRAHTDFVANASLELRTPLASIIGYVETLRDDDGRVDVAKRNRFLDTVLREAQRMRSLVEDLMSLSRIEAEKHQVPADKIDLSSTAQAIAKDVAAVHGDHRIRFNIETPHSFVLGDHAQIDQLIRNLVDNGLKYGAPDEAVTVSVQPVGDSVMLIVQDKGAGIEPDHLPHLTRRFYRTDPGRSQAAGGTGLGLAIVKHIVERHRGTLDITSVVNEGTCVSVRFPALHEAL